MSNEQIAALISQAFELLNEPKSCTPQTVKYRMKDVDLALDKLIVAMRGLGLEYE